MNLNVDEELSTEEFWLALDELVNLPLDYGETEEDSINKKLVSYITLISKFTTYHEFESEQQEFEFFYKLTKKLTCNIGYESNIVFCMRKLLSLMEYIISNDNNFVTYYAANPEEKMDNESILYLDSNSNFIKASSFIILINYKLDRGIIDILQEFQGFHIISQVLVDNYNRDKCPQLKAQHAVYKNLMELLYEFCKNVKLSAAELNKIDSRFIYYLLESIRGLTKIEDEYNFYKFKIVVILNEQYMVSFYEQQAGACEPCENKIFTTLLQNDELFRNFSDCLILNFNRETDDHVIQILILKILYLIFTTSMTCQRFYLNDLKVLIDIFVRELNNLSIADNQIPLINTYLRVIYPMLLFSQLKEEKYKSKYLVELSENLLRELDDFDSYNLLINEENLSEVPTTKRLVLRLLKHLKYETLRTDSISSEISNNSVTNINKLNSKSADSQFQKTEEEIASRQTSRSSSVVSQISSSSSNSKKIPPPIPLPRKTIYKYDSSSEISFATASPTIPKR